METELDGFQPRVLFNRPSWAFAFRPRSWASSASTCIAYPLSRVLTTHFLHSKCLTGHHGSVMSTRITTSVICEVPRLSVGESRSVGGFRCTVHSLIKGAQSVLFDIVRIQESQCCRTVWRIYVKRKALVIVFAPSSPGHVPMRHTAHSHWLCATISCSGDPLSP